MIQNERGKKVAIYQIGAVLPLVMLFLIIISVYSIYLVEFKTYLVPLMKGTYLEEPIGEIIEDITYLIQVVLWNDSIFDKVFFQFMQNKGLLLCVILHFLIILLLTTIVSIIRSNAGPVPNKWVNSINNEIQAYIQNENAIMKECIQKKKQCTSHLIIYFILKEIKLQQKLSQLQNSQHSDLSTQYSNGQENQKLNSSIDDNSQISEINDDLRLELNMRAKIELIDKQGRRFCKNCASFKPPRCHHCRSCGICWLKMDHHCQWLNTCIGLRNYKVFINLICYAWACLFFIAFTYSKCYYDTIIKGTVSDFRLYLVSFNFFFDLMLLFLLTGFCIFHFWQFCEIAEFKDAG